jgi:hypothetical protein
MLSASLADAVLLGVARVACSTITGAERAGCSLIEHISRIILKIHACDSTIAGPVGDSRTRLGAAIRFRHMVEQAVLSQSNPEK